MVDTFEHGDGVLVRAAQRTQRVEGVDSERHELQRMRELENGNVRFHRRVGFRVVGADDGESQIRARDRRGGGWCAKKEGIKDHEVGRVRPGGENEDAIIGEARGFREPWEVRRDAVARKRKGVVAKV